MDPFLAFLTQPLTVLVIGIAVFTGRVIYLAKRLRSASRAPTLADLRALEDAKKSLDAHHESIDGARAALHENLGGARDTLRHYKGALNTSVEGRRKGMEEALHSLDEFKAPLDQAKANKNAAFKKGLRDAKKLYKSTVPRKGHGAPKDI